MERFSWICQDQRPVRGRGEVIGKGFSISESIAGAETTATISLIRGGNKGQGERGLGGQRSAPRRRGPKRGRRGAVSTSEGKGRGGGCGCAYLGGERGVHAVPTSG